MRFFSGTNVGYKHDLCLYIIKIIQNKQVILTHNKLNVPSVEKNVCTFICAKVSSHRILRMNSGKNSKLLKKCHAV